MGTLQGDYEVSEKERRGLSIDANGFVRVTIERKMEMLRNELSKGEDAKVKVLSMRFARVLVKRQNGDETSTGAAVEASGEPEADITTVEGEDSSSIDSAISTSTTVTIETITVSAIAATSESSESTESTLTVQEASTESTENVSVDAGTMLDAGTQTGSVESINTSSTIESSLGASESLSSSSSVTTSKSTSSTKSSNTASTASSRNLSETESTEALVKSTEPTESGQASSAASPTSSSSSDSFVTSSTTLISSTASSTDRPGSTSEETAPEETGSSSTVSGLTSVTSTSSINSISEEPNSVSIEVSISISTSSSVETTSSTGVDTLIELSLPTDSFTDSLVDSVTVSLEPGLAIPTFFNPFTVPFNDLTAASALPTDDPSNPSFVLPGVSSGGSIDSNIPDALVSNTLTTPIVFLPTPFATFTPSASGSTPTPVPLSINTAEIYIEWVTSVVTVSPTAADQPVWDVLGTLTPHLATDSIGAIETVAPTSTDVEEASLISILGEAAATETDVVASILSASIASEVAAEISSTATSGAGRIGSGEVSITSSAVIPAGTGLDLLNDLEPEELSAFLSTASTSFSLSVSASLVATISLDGTGPVSTGFFDGLTNFGGGNEGSGVLIGDASMTDVPSSGSIFGTGFDGSGSGSAAGVVEVGSEAGGDTVPFGVLQTDVPTLLTESVAFEIASSSSATSTSTSDPLTSFLTSSSVATPTPAMVESDTDVTLPDTGMPTGPTGLIDADAEATETDDAGGEEA